MAAWPRDQEPIRRIREAVFVREQGVPPALEWDGLDPDCIQVLALDASGEPIATARMTGDGHVGRMAVVPAWRRQGLGRAMLDLLIGLARSRGLRRVWLNAQTQALPFYLGHGFNPVGAVFMDAGILHQRMEMDL